MDNMLVLGAIKYHHITTEPSLPLELDLVDHLDGFDEHGNNRWLQALQQRAKSENRLYRIRVSYPRVPNKFNYTNLDIGFKYFSGYDQLLKYKQHPEKNFKHFVCSFNGAEHVSRKLLLGAMHVRGWTNPNTVSKNFAWPTEQMLGHIGDYAGDQYNYYKPFFVNPDSDRYHASINRFGSYTLDNPSLKYDNFIFSSVQELEPALISSFIHVVSESLGTSYFPFATEKFMYSVATRGLFVGYAQPGWHYHLEQVWGFRMFRNLFDYRFDNEDNPVLRAVLLTDMLSRFEHLSCHDWHDLYLLERDTIEYNYDHYYSGDFKKCLGVI